MKPKRKDPRNAPSRSVEEVMLQRKLESMNAQLQSSPLVSSSNNKSGFLPSLQPKPTQEMVLAHYNITRQQPHHPTGPRTFTEEDVHKMMEDVMKYTRSLQGRVQDLETQLVYASHNAMSKSDHFLSMQPYHQQQQQQLTYSLSQPNMVQYQQHGMVPSSSRPLSPNNPLLASSLARLPAIGSQAVANSNNSVFTMQGGGGGGTAAVGSTAGGLPAAMAGINLASLDTAAAYDLVTGIDKKITTLKSIFQAVNHIQERIEASIAIQKIIRGYLAKIRRLYYTTAMTEWRWLRCKPVVWLLDIQLSNQSKLDAGFHLLTMNRTMKSLHIFYSKWSAVARQNGPLRRAVRQQAEVKIAMKRQWFLLQHLLALKAVTIGNLSRKHATSERRKMIDGIRLELSAALKAKGELGIVPESEVMSVLYHRVVQAFHLRQEYLAKSYKLAAWKRLIAMKHAFKKASKTFRFKQCAGRCFMAWSDYTYLKSMNLDRKRWPGPRRYEVRYNQKRVNHFSKVRCQRFIFHAWKAYFGIQHEVKVRYRRKIASYMQEVFLGWKKVAGRYHNLRMVTYTNWTGYARLMTSPVFAAWADYTRGQKNKFQEHMRIAKSYIRWKTRQKIMKIVKVWRHQALFGRLDGLYSRQMLLKTLGEQKILATSIEKVMADQTIELEENKQLVEKEIDKRKALETEIASLNQSNNRLKMTNHHFEQELKRLESTVQAMALINPKHMRYLTELQQSSFRFKERNIALNRGSGRPGEASGGGLGGGEGDEEGGGGTGASALAGAGGGGGGYGAAGGGDGLGSGEGSGLHSPTAKAVMAAMAAVDNTDNVSLLSNTSDPTKLQQQLAMATAGAGTGVAKDVIEDDGSLKSILPNAPLDNIQEGEDDEDGQGGGGKSGRASKMNSQRMNLGQGGSLDGEEGEGEGGIGYSGSLANSLDRAGSSLGEAGSEGGRGDGGKGGGLVPSTKETRASFLGKLPPPIDIHASTPTAATGAGQAPAAAAQAAIAPGSAAGGEGAAAVAGSAPGAAPGTAPGTAGAPAGPTAPPSLLLLLDNDATRMLERCTWIISRYKEALLPVENETSGYGTANGSIHSGRVGTADLDSGEPVAGVSGIAAEGGEDSLVDQDSLASRTASLQPATKGGRGNKRVSISSNSSSNTTPNRTAVSDVEESSLLFAKNSKVLEEDPSAEKTPLQLAMPSQAPKGSLLRASNPFVKSSVSLRSSMGGAGAGSMQPMMQPGITMGASFNGMIPPPLLAMAGHQPSNGYINPLVAQQQQQAATTGLSLGNAPFVAGETFGSPHRHTSAAMGGMAGSRTASPPLRYSAMAGANGGPSPSRLGSMSVALPGSPPPPSSPAGKGSLRASYSRQSQANTPAGIISPAALIMGQSFGMAASNIGAMAMDIRQSMSMSMNQQQMQQAQQQAQSAAATASTTADSAANAGLGFDAALAAFGGPGSNGGGRAAAVGSLPAAATFFQQEQPAFQLPPGAGDFYYNDEELEDIVITWAKMLFTLLEFLETGDITNLPEEDKRLWAMNLYLRTNKDRSKLSAEELLRVDQAELFATNKTQENNDVSFDKAITEALMTVDQRMHGGVSWREALLRLRTMFPAAGNFSGFGMGIEAPQDTAIFQRLMKMRSDLTKVEAIQTMRYQVQYMHRMNYTPSVHNRLGKSATSTTKSSTLAAGGGADTTGMIIEEGNEESASLDGGAVDYDSDTSSQSSYQINGKKKPKKDKAGAGGKKKKKKQPIKPLGTDIYASNLKKLADVEQVEAEELEQQRLYESTNHSGWNAKGVGGAANMGGAGNAGEMTGRSDARSILSGASS